MNPRALFGQAVLVALDFEDLFDQHYDQIAAYLMRRVDRSTAEDIASMTFLEAYDRRASFDERRGTPRGWLFGISLNLMRHHFRDEQRRLRAFGRVLAREVESTDEYDDIRRRVDADSQAHETARALATLSRGDYEALTLHCWAELSHAEIATAVGIPKGTVKSRLNRARRKMREQLDQRILEANDG